MGAAAWRGIRSSGPVDTTIPLGQNRGPDLGFVSRFLKGRSAVGLVRHVNIVAACAAFAFVGAIVLGAF